MRSPAMCANSAANRCCPLPLPDEAKSMRPVAASRAQSVPPLSWPETMDASPARRALRRAAKSARNRRSGRRELAHSVALMALVWEVSNSVAVGAAFATRRCRWWPRCPGRFSTTTCWPRRRDISAAITRRTVDGATGGIRHDDAQARAGNSCASTGAVERHPDREQRNETAAQTVWFHLHPCASEARTLARPFGGGVCLLVEEPREQPAQPDVSRYWRARWCQCWRTVIGGNRERQRRLASRPRAR